MQSIDLQEVALQEVIQFQLNKKYKEGKQEIAINMLKKGMSTQTIKEITGLSKKEINKIKNKEKERQKAYA